MNESLQFFREFDIGIWGNICSIAAFILTVAVILWGFHAKIVRKKDDEIALLRKRIRTAETSSEAFLQTEYETLEKRKASESNGKDFLLRTEEEIAKRKSLKKKNTEQMDTALETMPRWSRTQVCGTYEVKCQNPLMPQESHFGELQIKERDEVLLGTWKFPTREIGASKQSDEGTGLLSGNELAFNFKHTDSEGTYTGVVIYEIMSDDLMRGYWTIFGESHVGFEECRKKKPDE